MTPEQDKIARERDPVKRAKAAHAYVDRGKKSVDAVRKIRDEAVAELRTAGWTQRAVAELIGVTPAMIVKIDRGQGVTSTRMSAKQPPPEKETL